VTGAPGNDESTLGRVADDPELLISDFFHRLDELETLAREIKSRLAQAGPLPAAAARRSPDFELVVVCTGNRARSPVAEGFLRVLLEGLPVRVSSAGLLDLGPVPALPETIETAAALGLDLSAHRARCLVGRDLSGADLVVGFEQRHVATAVVDGKAPREHTFTLAEIVDLLERVLPPTAVEPAERARQAVARAHALRQGRREGPPEISDPLGGSMDYYRTTVNRVRDLSERLAVKLFGFEAVQPLPAVAEPEPPPARRRILRATREQRS
jgi:protein-tyrosine phosphatase